MINLCLVVIATQFSETKKREMERMRQERARYTSTSTLASSTNNSEPATCYAEIVKYIAHLWRRFKRRMLKKYRLYKYAGCSFNYIFSFLSLLFEFYLDFHRIKKTKKKKTCDQKKKKKIQDFLRLHLKQKTKRT